MNTTKNILGYRIMASDSTPSFLNSPTNGADIEVNQAHLFRGDEDANHLFPDRAMARKVRKEEALSERWMKGYTVKPVYALVEE